MGIWRGNVENYFCWIKLLKELDYMMTKPEPGHVTWTKLSDLTGLGRDHLRHIAKAGMFKEESCPASAPALLGIIKWLRRQLEESHGEINYNSEMELSHATGIPESKIRAAKKHGCDAFNRDGTIRLTAFLRWLNAQDDEWAALELRKLRANTGFAETEEQRNANKLAVEKKELMPWDDVQKVVRNGSQSMRQRLNALPSEAAHLCNPTDPEHARLALEGWVKSSLPIIRETNDKLDMESGLQ